MSYEITVGIGFPSGVERAVALAVSDASKLFPNQVRAIQELAEAGRRKWVGFASGNEALPDGSRIRPWTGTYLRSIQLQEIPGGYSIYSDDPKAGVIEEGGPAWDLHKVLRTSAKVRRSKKGNLYLIIPFRHGTPNTVVVGEYTNREMPVDVAERMRSKAQSFITGSYTEPQVHNPHETVQRLTYDWGDRLTLTELEELGHDPTLESTQRMTGMVRMAANTPNQTSSVYLTFRTLSENNPAGTWVIPKRKGKYPAQAVANWLRESFPDIMRVALELDAEHIQQLAGIA